MKKAIKKYIALSFLVVTSSIITIGAFNTTNSAEPVLAYTQSEFSPGRASDLSSWTFNSDSMVTKANNWMGGFALYNNADTTLNFENRPEYTVSAEFKGSDVSSSITNMYRGLVLYYLDDSNWLTALAKWNYDDRRTEIQELMLYGEINGNYYKTSAEETPVEWRDLWVDGNQIPATDKVTITAQIQTFDNNTDNVIISASSSSGSCSKSQFVFSLQKQVSASIYRKPKVGVCAFHNAGNIDSPVTITNLTFTNQAYDGYTPILVETGNRITEAYVNRILKLPSFTATNGRNDILEYTRVVLDPNNNPVEVDKKGRFTPTLLGEYKVSVTCRDERFDEDAEPINYSIMIYPEPKDILLYETGVRPTAGYLDEKIILPEYEYNYNLKPTIRVKDELGNEINLEDNSFVPKTTGYYFVNVSLNHSFIEVNDVNYYFYVYNQRNTNNISYNNTDNSGLVAFVIYLSILLTIGACIIVPIVVIKINKNN